MLILGWLCLDGRYLLAGLWTYGSNIQFLQHLRAKAILTKALQSVDECLHFLDWRETHLMLDIKLLDCNQISPHHVVYLSE